MTIYINPMSQFPYDVNRSNGTYFDRNKVRIDEKIMGFHYCVGYEGKDFALSSWAYKQSKDLTNIATFFEGSTIEEKRQLLWHKIQTRTLPKRTVRFFEQFRTQDLYLWYLSSHDLATAQFIQRFMNWYFEQ